ncbi:MAG: Na+-dependent transporter [Pseudorhodoplanes sp.]|nr:Na+-dependent transporter [Pseudorhodoplanes sp.]
MAFLTTLAAILAAILAWLGRQGTRAVAVSVFAGIALPPLAALFKPVFAEALVVLLALAFLRVDPAALRGHFVRPGPVIAASIWTLVAVPLMAGLILRLLGVESFSQALFAALVLQAAAPPVISSPALAALMGLDAALSLATLIVATTATPITAPVFAALFLGPSMEISPLGLGLKLFGMLGGAAVAAWLVRRIKGQDWVERQQQKIDGLSVIALFVFAVALMDGVAANIISRPLTVLALLALAFVLALGLIALTYAVMIRVGRSPALALGFAVGSRNMGLMLAAAGTAVPDLMWLYFALAQFPIYLLPQLLKPLARRINTGK